METLGKGECERQFNKPLVEYYGLFPSNSNSLILFLIYFLSIVTKIRPGRKKVAESEHSSTLSYHRAIKWHIPVSADTLCTGVIGERTTDSCLSSQLGTKGSDSWMLSSSPMGMC